MAETKLKPQALKFSGAKARKTSNQTGITTGVYIDISWDSVGFDTDSYWSGGNPTRLTAPVTGKYLIIGNTHLDALGAGTYRGASIQLNGARTIDTGEIRTGAIGYSYQSVSVIMTLTAGDYVELAVFQDQGSDGTVGTTNCNFSIMRVD